MHHTDCAPAPESQERQQLSQTSHFPDEVLSQVGACTSVNRKETKTIAAAAIHIGTPTRRRMACLACRRRRHERVSAATRRMDGAPPSRRGGAAPAAHIAAERSSVHALGTGTCTGLESRNSYVSTSMQHGETLSLPMVQLYEV
eukprot:COSAG02_NODE_19549_length_876_cov_2.202059_1_plen_144_part_00